ncbi:protein SINE [Salix suchowensis]|nr:protein SINE [Salix suchowensis]
MERLRIVVPKKSPKSRTGRNLSPLLRQELANLNDDSDSRKSAMKALKSYVIGLDSNANPQFRAQVNNRKKSESITAQELANLEDDGKHFKFNVLSKKTKEAPKGNSEDNP